MAGECCCCCCICLLLLVTPITLLSLTLVTHNPKIDLQDFFIPSLNNPADQSNGSITRLNTFIFIDLQLRNVMPLNGLRYEALNLTFYYGGNRSFPVATYAVSGFYQGARKTARKREVVTTRGLPWEDAFDRVSRGQMVDFVLELAMTVKLRRAGAYTKRKVVVVAADVSLDGSTGGEVDNKAIRLH